MRPMLATRGERLPAGEEWLHEVKWDGMRVLATVDEGRARLRSRNENDVTVSFPELGPVAGPSMLLDGEVVAFDDGRPSFGALAERMHQRRPERAAALARRRPVTFIVFDLLQLEGRDLCGEPLERRRALLEGLGPIAEHVLVPPTYDDGAMLWEATRAQQLEGVVSKRLGSRYVPGERSRSWLKFPHRPLRSWVVGGWREETGSRRRVGALLVGEPTADGLLYRGRVGSGIGPRAVPPLMAALTPIAADRSPFVDEVPRADALGTHWVEPVLVVDVESLGFSHHDRLRQPAFRGLRTDLEPEDLWAR